MKAMPSLFKMTDAKDTASETPVVIAQVAAVDPKSRITKKIVIIAVSAVLAVAIILTAILVGMYLFTKGQNEILKYTMNLDKDTKLETTTDQNENINQYHMQKPNYEMWVVDDFNRDIKLMKIQTETDTNCYLVPLNRTATFDPSKIKTLSDIKVKQNATERLFYDVANTPISDVSFLGKTAKETCKGISVYWIYPKCNEDTNAVQRKKRSCDCYYDCYYCTDGYDLYYCCDWVCYC